MEQNRAELAAVIVALQAAFSLVAGLTALPFAIVEPGFRLLALVTIVVAALMFWLAGNLRRRRRWAKRWLIALEAASLVPTVLLGILPIGAIRGPVPLLVNLGLPASVLVLLLIPAKAAVAESPPARDQAQ